MKKLTILTLLTLTNCGSCDKTGYESDAGPVPSTSSSTAPSASSATEPPKVRWAVVETLGSVTGRWGVPPDAEGPWAAIEKGKTPYPWRVTFATSENYPEYNCGVYDQLTDDWRVAYCKGGPEDADQKEPRKAMRLTLHVKPDAPEQIRLQLSTTDINLILGKQ